MTSADTYIQKTKKLYMDTRTQRNISKLNEDLTEVHSIMTKNIQDVLGQGERLDSEPHSFYVTMQNTDPFITWLQVPCLHLHALL